MSTINDRIQEVINVVARGNASRFARMCDVSASIINSIIGGRKSEPSFSVLSKIYTIASEYDISAHWLLTGEGNMIYKPKATPNTLVVDVLQDAVNCLEDKIREKDDVISQRDRLISNILSKCVK